MATVEPAVLAIHGEQYLYLPQDFDHLLILKNPQGKIRLVWSCREYNKITSMGAMIESKKLSVYKRGRRSFATWWLWINVFLVAIAVFLYRSNALPAPVWAVLLINLILFVSVIATVNLKEIRINEETGNVTILLDRFLFINRTVECAVQDILLTSHVRPSARGMEVQVFGIFVKGDLIIEAIPGLSGWPESTLQSVRGEIDVLQKTLLPL